MISLILQCFITKFFLYQNYVLNKVINFIIQVLNIFLNNDRFSYINTLTLIDSLDNFKL